MKVHYKLDGIGKVESFVLVGDESPPPEGFFEAGSEDEFERLTGCDLDGITCEYSENKRNLASTANCINRPLEDIILALMQAEINLPPSLIEQVIDKQEKRNKFLKRKGVIITGKGSCYHSHESCPSLSNVEINYITEAQAINDGLARCSKCVGCTD